MPAAEEEESARNLFRQMDLRGRAKDDTQLKTVHQNTVTKLRVYQEAGGSLKKFSSKSSAFLVLSAKFVTNKSLNYS